MSDVYAAITDSAINRAIRFLMTWRPSLFNYVAPSQHFAVPPGSQVPVFGERWLVCQALTLPAALPLHHRYTRVPPLKIKGFPGIPYCIQITDLAIDFQPSNAVGLPAELEPPLADQQFALWGKVQAGVGCPPDTLIDALLRVPRSTFANLAHGPADDMTFDVLALTCFSLELFATGHLYTDVEPGSAPPITRVRVALDGVEVKDLSPAGLEDAAECYARAAIRGWVLPDLLVALEPILVNALGVKSVVPTLVPNRPHNPAIEQDELRVWLDLALTI
jgi:hypothetical protein